MKSSLLCTLNIHLMYNMQTVGGFTVTEVVVSEISKYLHTGCLGMQTICSKFPQSLEGCWAALDNTSIQHYGKMNSKMVPAGVSGPFLLK